MAFSFNNNPQMSEEQAYQTWSALRSAIEKIQEGHASKLRFEELYRNSYTLVLHKHGILLYDGVVQVVREKLGKVVRNVVQASSDNLLEVLVEEWDNHKRVSRMIASFLMYMDKTFCKTHDKIPVYDVCQLLFRDTVVRNPAVNERLQKILLTNVKSERDGVKIDRVLMKNCLMMLVEVNVASAEEYEAQFEKKFLEDSRTFYQRECQEFMAQNTCPEYMRKVEARLRQEETRAAQYLFKATKPKLMSAVHDELITKYAKRLAEDEKTGCTQMFLNGQMEDLARMYELFSREKPTLAHIQSCMTKLVKETGQKIVTDKENLKNPKAFVQAVLDTRKRFDDFVINSFKNDPAFVRTLREALESFINLDSRSAQFLSLYIDDMLKTKVRGMSDHEVEERVKDVMSIFRYLQDKDIFEEFYKQHLCLRLLGSLSSSTDHEKRMIAKLKAECGQQYTSRLEGMFKDMESSKQLNLSYQNWCNSHSPPPVPISISILTSGFWPISSVEQAHLPSELETTCGHFRDFFSNQHNGRRLAWQTNQGTAEVRASFEQGRKELVVTTYQMLILMLYNTTDSITYKEIRDKTAIPESELPRQLLSLAHPQIGVLKKSPNTKAIEPTHSFTYNTKYKSKLFRIKIPLLSQRAVVGSQAAEIPAAVQEARKNGVEAAVVRVMKSRKTIEHNNLIAEVMKQLSSRFAVEPPFIKKRIESLIEREYLERDQENRKLYRYLA